MTKVIKFPPLSASDLLCRMWSDFENLNTQIDALFESEITMGKKRIRCDVFYMMLLDNMKSLAEDLDL